MWEIITNIGTPISLAAFIIAVFFKYLNNKTSNKINLIRLAPEDSRASLIESALETYNLKDDNLTKEQKFDLLNTVLKDKAKRFNISAIIFLIITVLILAFSAFIAPKLINKSIPPDDIKVELKNKISHVIENFNYNDIDRSKSYLIQLKNLIKKDSSEEIKTFTFNGLKSFYKSQTESAEFGYKSDDLTDPVREFRNSILHMMITITDNKLNIFITPFDFEYIDLANSDLSNLNLNGISFKGCFLIHTNFENSNLEDCNFNESFLRLTNFKNSNLVNASFNNADWYNAENLEIKQFSKINKKSIVYLAPTSNASLITALNDEYSFKYLDFPNSYKERLKENWREYLKKDGIIEVANLW